MLNTSFCPLRISLHFLFYSFLRPNFSELFWNSFTTQLQLPLQGACATVQKLWLLSAIKREEETSGTDGAGPPGGAGGWVRAQRASNQGYCFHLQTGQFLCCESKARKEQQISTKYNKATVIQSAWHWQKTDLRINGAEWKRPAWLQTHSATFSFLFNFFFSKGAKHTHWKKNSLLTDSTGTLAFYLPKAKTRPMSVTTP